MTKKRHIIWDWNGTLINDAWLGIEIANLQLRTYNLPEVSIERYRDLFTMPVRTFYGRLGFDVTDELFQDLAKLFHATYDSRQPECSLHHGIEKLLGAVQQQGATQSILSAHPAEPLLSTVRAYGIAEYFTEIIGSDNHYGHSKVEEGHRWMRESGKHEHDLLIVGDTSHDFEVSQELGIDCVLISHGFQSKAALQKCGVPVVETLAELEREILG